jgi:hypothetical protein
MNIKATFAICALLITSTPALAGVHPNSKDKGKGYGKKAVQIAAPVQSACTLHTYCIPQQVWKPGHYEQVQTQVWIPGKAKQVWIAPVYQEHCNVFGLTFKVLISGGHFVTQNTPGHYQVVHQNQYVPGQWETSCQAYAPAIPYAQPKAFYRAQYSAYNKHYSQGTQFGGYGAQSGYAGPKKKSGYGSW